ncbi:MAG: hypothetical protein ACXU7H_08765, partial [Burkholderiaceae bacterium]
MQINSTEADAYLLGTNVADDANTSGVSWGAVFAGAAAAAALSLILLILGVGLGLSAISPWSYNASAIGVSTIIWLAFVQLAASGVGGYLAGRLRAKWVSVENDEVYFRDTAHGLLTWAVASLVTAALMAGAIRAVASGAIDIGNGVSQAAAPAIGSSTGSNNGVDMMTNPMDYYSDMLLRTDQQPAPDSNRAALRSEVNKIFLSDMRYNKLTPEDRDYLSRLVAARTGLSQPDAERRVDDVFARAVKTTTDIQATARQTAETAR